MTRPLHGRALRLFVDVEDDELRALLVAFAYFFCLLSSYYVLRPVREMVGTLGGVRNLSWLFTGTFVAMLLAVPLFGAAVARLPRRVFVPLVYHFFVLHICVFALLIHLAVAERQVAEAFFVWTSVFNLFVVSVFWSVMADLFRADQSKRLYGFIAAGGTTGMLMASWFTSELASRLGIAGLLALSAVLLELAAVCATTLLRDSSRAPTRPDATSARLIGGGILAGLARVARSPYLLAICLYILCLTVTATVVYFQQASIVRSAFADRTDKTAFFALVNLLVGLLTVLVQLLVTGRLLRWLSVAMVLSLLPLTVGAGLVGLAIAPLLWVVVAFQALRRAANYALARPAREVLFTVVSREDKYKSKNVIDTVVYRGGDMMAGWAFSGLVALGLGLSAIAVTALPVAGFWLAIGIYLGREQAVLETQANTTKEE